MLFRSSELPTPQPLNVSCPPTPAAEAEPTQADIEYDEKMAVEIPTLEEPQEKMEVADHAPDVAMNDDIPEAGESEHNWNE